jgi:hypothetical protein
MLRTVPIDTMYHQRGIASPAEPKTIKTNVDTPYSRVVLEVSYHDVVHTVPDVTGKYRYWNYPVVDVFGNIIADVGSVNHNQLGNT